jgi:hypothetical protein
MPARDARVVDERVYSPLVRGDVGGGAGDRNVIAHVDLHESRANPVGGSLTAPGVPGADDHGLALSG